MALLAWETIIEALLAGDRPPAPEPAPVTLALERARHQFLEGDNLAVLRALHPAYRGQVRVAYLDPPYNTGHRRMYRDQFALPVAEYRAYLQRIDPTGHLARRIPEKAGRAHLGWLTMLLPRLQALQPLLHPTGMLFCSIDDTEFAHLGVTLRRLLGESNYLTTIVWLGRIPSNSVKYISTVVSNRWYSTENAGLESPLSIGYAGSQKEGPSDAQERGLCRDQSTCPARSLS